MKTSILHFEEGKYSPKIEILSDYKSSIFKDIYDKGFNCLKEILMNQKKADESKEKYENNNIIAFIGERGGGKTSCMMSFEKILLKSFEDKDKMSNPIFMNNPKIFDYSYETLDIIDPSFFTEKSNILEIIIATLFKKFKEKSDTNLNIDSQKEISRYFKNIYKYISIINNQYNFDGENYDKLQDLSATITLKEDIKKLIDKYLLFIDNDSNKSKKKLIIKIDDIDLNIKYAYEMIEQIRKYLIQDNIIILMAVKLNQLEEIIKFNYLKSFDLRTTEIDLQYEHMSYRYLEKLIPQSRRLYLINLENQLKNITIKISKNNVNNTNNPEESDTNIDVRQLIFDKLRILFLNDNMKNNPIVPKNLRFLINFINIFVKLDDIGDKKDNDKIELFKKNIVAFDNYFFNSWIDNNLTGKNIKIIKELHNKHVGEKNKYIVTKILEELEKLDPKNKFNSTEILSKLDKINKYKFISTNISLGDVLESISNLEKVAVDKEYENFLIAIKILYARYIYDYYLDYKKKEREDKNSLEYSDFEIFLGGEVILSKNLLYNPKNFESINPKTFHSKFKYIFETQDILLKEIEKNISNPEDKTSINELNNKLKEIEFMVFLIYFFKDINAPRKRLNGNIEDFKQLGKLCDETFYNGTYDFNAKNNISSIEFDICSPFFFNLSEYRLLNRYIYKDQTLYDLLMKINECTEKEPKLYKINVNIFEKIHLRNIELIEKTFKQLKPKSSSDTFEVIKHFYKNFISFNFKTDIKEINTIDYTKQYSKLLEYFENPTTKKYFNNVIFSIPSTTDIKEILHKISKKKSYKSIELLITNEWIVSKFKKTFKEKDPFNSSKIQEFFQNILTELDDSND